MAPKWNPRSVFDIDPDSYSFTCCGTTKKGARCRQSMISGKDLANASRILDQISLHSPSSGSVKEALPVLANLTLCPRWHRKPGYSQVDETVRKWERKIGKHCASNTQTTLNSSSRSTRSSASISNTRLATSHIPHEDLDESLAPRSSTVSSSEPWTGLSTPSIQYGSSRSVEIWTHSTPTMRDPSLREWVTPPPSRLPTQRNNSHSSSALLSSRRTSTDSSSSFSSSSSSSSSSSRHNPPPARQNSSNNANNRPPAVPSLPQEGAESSSPPRHLQPSSTGQEDNEDILSVVSLPRASIDTSPSSLSHRDDTITLSFSFTQQPSSPSEPYNPPPPPTSPPSASSNPTNSTTTPSTRRKPITEPCAICLSPISSPSVAVWCRAQCGQNVHRTCFAEWRKQCLKSAAQQRRRNRGFSNDGDEDGVEELQRLESAVSCMFCRARWRWEWEVEEGEE